MNRLLSLILAFGMYALATGDAASTPTAADAREAAAMLRESVAPTASAGEDAGLRYINLETAGILDYFRVCNNPHKGWYYHHNSNSFTNYNSRTAPGDWLEDFPCLDHIYIRLAWKWFEPEEGKFNWAYIDSVAAEWTKHGYKVAFRITAKETGRDQEFATPRWVMEAGAKGTFFGEIWEPDYGDPVFLEKLENFHRAFAARYDAEPWVAYVDIGSYGDWGEGHTNSGRASFKDWPVEVIRKHIDIYLKYYTHSVLVASDDLYSSRHNDDGSREEILAYLLENGIAIRDDGISVEWFRDRFGFSTLRNPGIYDYFWRDVPTVLELEHYASTKRIDSYKGGEPMAAALEEMHATWCGFHYYPREWLAENPELATRLANRMGYWYIPTQIVLPARIRPGDRVTLRISWLNKGVAPAYHRYPLTLMLENTVTGAQFEQAPAESDNRAWAPGRLTIETVHLDLPRDLPAGTYRLRLRLHTEDPFYHGRAIELGLKDEVRGKDGFYTVGEVVVK